MIPYKTLELYQKKCEDALGAIDNAINTKEEEIAHLKKQRIAAQAQLEIVSELMAEEHPISELPFAGDKIEELHEKRLEMFADVEPEDFYKYRQEAVYKTEAAEYIDAIDADNKKELGEGA